MSAATVTGVRSASTIAARDARELWRDGRFRGASALLLVILAVALLTGALQTRAVQRLHEDAQRTERASSLDKGEMNPHAAAHYGAFVFRPIEPLAAVDPGVDPFVGVSVFLEAHQQQLARHRPAEDASPVRRLGELTAAVGLQLLVPLLIVVITSASFASEREQGTLRQLASVGVSPWVLTAGKSFGAAAPLLAVLAPATAIGVAALAPAAMRDPETWARLALVVAAYLMYFAVWIAIGLIVSARARTPRSALISLLAIWFGAVVVAPPVAAALSAALSPAPTGAEMTAAMDDAKAALLRWDQRVERVEERFLAGEIPTGAGVPSNPDIIALIDAENDETALYDRHFDQLFEAYDRQAAWYGRLGILTPSLAVQALSMAMAGTDYDHYRQFVTATSQYRRTFVQTLNAELSAYEGANVFDYTAGRELWQTIPAFSYQPPLLRDSLRRQAAPAAALGGWLLAALAGLAWTGASMRID